MLNLAIKMCSVITLLKWLSHLPWANKLISVIHINAIFAVDYGKHPTGNQRCIYICGGLINPTHAEFIETSIASY